jgi:tetratricopeptide (TPR) repeat protein
VKGLNWETSKSDFSRFAKMSRILIAMLMCGLMHSSQAALDPEVAREQALAQTHHTDLDKRRRAYAWLGEVARADDLPVLLVALYDDDPIVRSNAEASVWQVWSRSGDATTDEVFQIGLAEMQRGELNGAIDTFSQLIAIKPDFAEAWNKRATLYFLMENYAASVKDCDEVLKRNPQHFGALAGYGQIMLRMHQPRRALDYFERALAINPNMGGVESVIDALREMLPNEDI